MANPEDFRRYLESALTGRSPYLAATLDEGVAW